MNSGLNGRPRALYNFRKPIPERWLERSQDLLETLSATAAFRRLRFIRFLGAIDYALIAAPNYKKGIVRHTRYHHSRGVARLSLEYSALNHLSERETLTIMSAALLHDIGHSPLSHSLEPIFDKEFGFDHHKTTIDIISGRNALGREILGVLRDWFIDIDEVIALISGKDKAFHSFFSGPINFDTIEGIFRSYTYIAQPTNALNPHHVVDAATLRSTEKHRDIVDEFWGYKDRIYTTLINSRSGILADFVAQHIARNHLSLLAPSDALSTDEKLFRKIPKLKSALRSPSFARVALALPEDLAGSKSRRFYIDSRCNFFNREDELRYRQLKQPKRSINDSSADFLANIEKDLFDDTFSDQLGLFD